MRNTSPFEVLQDTHVTASSQCRVSRSHTVFTIFKGKTSTEFPFFLSRSWKTFSVLFENALHHHQDFVFVTLPPDFRLI